MSTQGVNPYNSVGPTIAKAKEIFVVMDVNDIPGYTLGVAYKVKRAWVRDSGVTRPIHRQAMPPAANDDGGGGPPKFSVFESDRSGDTMTVTMRPLDDGTPYNYTRSGIQVRDMDVGIHGTNISFTVSGNSLSFTTVRQHHYTFDMTVQTVADAGTETAFVPYQSASAPVVADTYFYQDPRPAL
jgi:hypothetical protein